MNKIPSDRYIMIIGAMKSGTTTLFNYLAQHPEICPSIPKEPNYFSEEQTKKYEELFNYDDEKHQYVLEASTNYSKYPSFKNVPKNIHQYGINPKFIYIMRNPIDRIVSHYNFLKGSIYEPSSITSEHLINTSKYYLQLEQFRSFFPKNEFLLIDFDELTNNPNEILHSICIFLNIPPFQINNQKIYNKTITRNTPFEFITQNFRFLLPLTPKFIKKIIKKLLSLEILWSRTKLRRKQIKLIEKCLYYDMVKLNEEYGFDINKWGFSY